MLVHTRGEEHQSLRTSVLVIVEKNTNKTTSLYFDVQDEFAIHY